ncbi:hypothetical protein LINPERPRIM_LOCUS6811 [Linum perenne]
MINYIDMYPGAYTVEVTSLSHEATEKEVCDFFAHCGVIEHIEIISGSRSGEYACTAYVTFRDAYAIETAILLSVSCYMHLRYVTLWLPVCAPRLSLQR